VSNEPADPPEVHPLVFPFSLVTLTLFAILATIGDPTQWLPTIDYWLNRYQGLLGAVATIGAGALVWVATQRQIAAASLAALAPRSAHSAELIEIALALLPKVRKLVSALRRFEAAGSASNAALEAEFAATADEFNKVVLRLPALHKTAQLTSAATASLQRIAEQTVLFALQIVPVALRHGSVEEVASAARELERMVIEAVATLRKERDAISTANDALQAEALRAAKRRY
jgi:hypothetical protein